uniref:Uncharacterized protein n=1 Tax=Romanomermis culicivorax TaxID=13658 RepID=A0A915I132_ROMCU
MNKDTEKNEEKIKRKQKEFGWAPKSPPEMIKCLTGYCQNGGAEMQSPKPDKGISSIIWMLAIIAILILIVLAMVAGLIIMMRKKNAEWEPNNLN